MSVLFSHVTLHSTRLSLTAFGLRGNKSFANFSSDGLCRNLRSFLNFTEGCESLIGDQSSGHFHALRFRNCLHRSHQFCLQSRSLGSYSPCRGVGRRPVSSASPPGGQEIELTTDMETVDTTERLNKLRELMRREGVAVYSMPDFKLFLTFLVSALVPLSTGSGFQQRTYDSVFFTRLIASESNCLPSVLC